MVPAAAAAIGSIVSENIRRYQKDNKVRGEELAGRLGINAATFYSKLSRKTYSLETLYEMAQALRVPPYQLLMRPGEAGTGMSLPCFSPTDYPRLPQLIERTPASQSTQAVDAAWLDIQHAERYVMLDIDSSSLEPRLRIGDRILSRRLVEGELFRPGLYCVWADGRMWWGRVRSQPDDEWVLREDNPKTGGEIRIPVSAVLLAFHLERATSAMLD